MFIVICNGNGGVASKWGLISTDILLNDKYLSVKSQHKTISGQRMILLTIKECSILQVDCSVL